MQWKDDDKHFDFVESNRTALISSTDGASSSSAAAPQVKIESLRDEWDDEIEDEVFIGVF